MGTTRVLLLRHAETAAPDCFHGAESDIGLGERGQRQAEEVAKHLVRYEPAALYCSAMRRAVETADPIARACGLVPRVIESLHERRMGPLSGRPRAVGLAAYEEAKRRWEAGELDSTHEGGESYAEIRGRVMPGWEMVVGRSAGQTVVVVAHGVVIRVLLTTLLEGYGPKDFSKIGIDNVAVNDLKFQDGQWTATALNQLFATELRQGA